MHVEIDDRRAFDVVAVLRVARRDRRVVEQAEAHRPRHLGVMAGRTHGDEGVRRFLVHHLVDRPHGAAGAAQCRLEAARRHRGVGVEPHHAFAFRRRGVADRLDVIHRVAERDDLERRHRRLLARQHLEPLVLQRLLDGAQAIRPLGMAERGEVIEAGGMAEEEGGHWLLLTCQGADANCAVIARESGRSSNHGIGDFVSRLHALHDGVAFAPYALGGGISSGTKKSTCSGWLGSTRYWSKSVTPSPARNVSSIRKFPVKLLGLWKMR